MGNFSKGVLLATCLLLNIIAISRCDDTPKLQILPVPPIPMKAVGKSLLLTCRPDNAEAGLITDLQWRDPYNRTIQPQYVTAGGPVAPMHTEVLSDNSLALYIPSLTERMAGEYYCSANYANTQRLEVNVRIETKEEITWTNAPQEQFPILGKDERILCEVTANPAPTVDWQRDGQLIQTAGRFVVEPRGLLIKGVREEDDGTYVCRAFVINTGELAKRFIKVEVHTAPVIEEMVTDLEIVEGESASVTCVAKGKPQPIYTWVKRSTQENLATTDRFTVNEHTGVLTITRGEHNDFGDYVCTAKNAAGEANAVVKIEVIVKPKVFQFANDTAAVQNEIKLICRATGRPIPSITFKKHGSEDKYVQGTQQNDDRIILEQEQNKELSQGAGILTITNVIRADDGLYECIASNKGGTYYKNGHLQVKFPPSFANSKNQPPVFSWDQRVGNLSCLAESIPNATITWMVGNRKLEERQGIRIVNKGPQSNLLITPHDRSFYTMYKCVAINELGQAELDIEFKEAKPPLLIQGARVNNITATTITFGIIGPPTENGLPIMAYLVQYREDSILDWKYSRNHTWTVDSPYILEGLIPEVTYQFRFAAKNMVGVGGYGGNLRQGMPKRSFPEPPRILKSQGDIDGIVMSPYADHFELRWNVPADNGEPIDLYRIKYCPVIKQNGEWNEFDNLCKEQELRAFENTAYELNDLTADTYYRIELKAHNAIDDSPPAQLIIKTARGMDTIIRSENPVLSSASIIGIVVGSVLLLLIIVDLCCFAFGRIGLLATICHAKSKKSIDEDEAKLGSLYGWRFPLPYCSSKEPPPSPLPLPPPVKLAVTPMDETEPLQTDRTPVIDDSMKRNTSVEFDGKRVYSKTGEIIGKNSAV